MKTENIILIFLLSVLIVPGWFLVDNQPPYIRESGIITPADPRECGSSEIWPDVEKVGIYPGSCVSVQWNINVLRNCPPNTPQNVTRSIIDSERVKWSMVPVKGTFGTINKPLNEITRFFRIPTSIATGPAIFHSLSTFACNPLQKFWPIKIDTPDLPFIIDNKP